jgi:hypothetical protein
MKKTIFMLMALTMMCISASTYAQSATTKIAVSEEPTAANVLKWTKEVLPKMEPLIPRLEKIKANSTGQTASDALHLLAQVNHLKAINTKGTRLKATEAKRYYDLIAATVNKFYIECKSQNGDVCCVDCHNHGILGVWCFANCFVARVPDIN